MYSLFWARNFFVVFLLFLFFFKYEPYKYSRCQKKLFLLIKKELKIFFNKNESNQNVVTIHSLHLAFSTSQHLLIQLHWMIQLHWLIQEPYRSLLRKLQKKYRPLLRKFFLRHLILCQEPPLIDFDNWLQINELWFQSDVWP